MTDKYSFGDFSFIKDKNVRMFLEYDFNVINRIGDKAWKEFRDHDTSKSFIYDTYGVFWDMLNKKVYPAHSERTYGLSMRIFEYIAKNNWNKFVSNNIKN
jgi:Fe-S cluster biosynthesis and repair protein YggX